MFVQIHSQVLEARGSDFAFLPSPALPIILLANVIVLVGTIRAKIAPARGSAASVRRLQDVPACLISRLRRGSSLPLKKGEQVGVDLVRIGGGHAVRKAWIDFQCCVLQ